MIVNSALNSALNHEYEISALQFLAKELCPLHCQLLSKLLEEIRFMKNCLKDLPCLCSSQSFPTLSQAHREEDNVVLDYIGIRFD